MPESMLGQPVGTIAIVAHTHPSISKGGAEIAAYALYCGLRSCGVDAIFIAICPSESREMLSLGSDREFAIISNPLRYDHFYHLSAGDVWQQLKAILVGNEVRLVSFHHFLQIGVNSLRALTAETGIPFTLTLHEFLAICAHHGQMVTRPARRLCQAPGPSACATCFPEHSRQQFAARKQLIQSALLLAAVFVSPSQFLAERMVAWGLPQDRFVVIENGLRSAQGGEPRPRASIDGRPWVFGYFGQITPFKGADTLLDTVDLLARQPDIGRMIRIRVHGNLMGQEAPFIARFNDTFARHGFATYAGPYDNADVRTLMQACDYVLVPSTWWENSPVVIQEAFGAGRPVICTGIGGMAEKVPNRRAGLHFRLGDAADLARAMFEAADEVLYQALCSGLPEVGGHEAMARDYLAVFSRLVPSPVIGPPARSVRRRGKSVAQI
jgi:glycosyltransferase involved in cell wall biosynthesis